MTYYEREFFKLGEITADEAIVIVWELAMRHTHKDNAFLACPLID